MRIGVRGPGVVGGAGVVGGRTDGGGMVGRWRRPAFEVRPRGHRLAGRRSAVRTCGRSPGCGRRGCCCRRLLWSGGRRGELQPGRRRRGVGIRSAGPGSVRSRRVLVRHRGILWSSGRAPIALRRVRRGVQRSTPFCRSTPAASCGSLPKVLDLVRTTSTGPPRRHAFGIVHLWCGGAEPSMALCRHSTHVRSGVRGSSRIRMWEVWFRRTKIRWNRKGPRLRHIRREGGAAFHDLLRRSSGSRRR